MATERVKTQRIIDCLREVNGLVSLAAKRVPCSMTTIYTRARDVAAVRQAIDECRSELVDYGELALRRAVIAGEPWAVAMVLKTLGKSRGYSEKIETESHTVVEWVYGNDEAARDVAGATREAEGD